MRIGIEEVDNIIRELQSTEDIITNIVPGCLQKYDSADCIRNTNSAIFIVKNHLVFKAYFIGKKESLVELFQSIPQKASVEWIQRTEGECELNDLFVKGGFSKYKVYVRETTTFHSYPGDYPIKGKRAILREMYDPECGEYAECGDAEQLYELNKNIFDPYGDDIYTIEEWKQIARDKRCIVYKEGTEIVAYYVFELQGKKLYSNLSVNKTGANILYNLEQRIFDYYWNSGIRTFYGWCDISNTKSILRGDRRIPEAIKTVSFLYNFIYVKE